MSIELSVKLIRPTKMADILTEAECRLSGVPHGPFRLMEPVVDPSDLLLGPSRWEDDALISDGRVAKVGLWVMYHRRLDELQPRGREPTDAERRAIEEMAGYWAMIDAGVLRTRASFCLAALIACGIASRNRSRILDESNRLQQGQWADPDALSAVFARFKDADSFEEFADAFCDEVDFARDWPSARADLAERKVRLN